MKKLFLGVVGGRGILKIVLTTWKILATPLACEFMFPFQFLLIYYLCGFLMWYLHTFYHTYFPKQIDRQLFNLIMSQCPGRESCKWTISKMLGIEKYFIYICHIEKYVCSRILLCLHDWTRQPHGKQHCLISRMWLLTSDYITGVKTQNI